MSIPVVSLLVSFVLVAAYAAFILLKIPALLQGRLWAEDGLFLVDALQRPWWQALVTPHTDYIDVVASGAMLIATHVTDLDHVALLSVLLALLIQLCPAVLLVTSRCVWLQPSGMLMTALLLALTPPVAEEVWLSPVTSQYHLMICAALILAFEPRTGPIGVLQLMLLLTAGLTGPGPALVAPLFIARAWFDQSRRRVIQAAILSMGALIEIAVFYTHPVGRHLGIEVSLLLRTIYVKHVLVPLFGHALPKGMFFLVQWSIIPIVVPLFLLGGLSFIVLRTRTRDVRWLYAATLSMMVLSYFGAIGQADLLQVYSGARYYYAPQVLLGLTLLGLARTGPQFGRHGIMLLVGWLVFVGVKEYRKVNPVMAQGPSWKDQLTLWRAAPDRSIALWPPSFQIHLLAKAGSSL